MKNRKQKMFFSLIMACLVFNSILITEIFAATTVVIDKPQLGDDFDHLLNQEYIVFKFRIFGGYQSYSTFIDGQYDSILDHVGIYINYNVNLFISKYGRGEHTFTVSVKTSGLVPLSMMEGGTDSTIIKSVEFTVNPVLCHFVGFGHNDDPNLEYWMSNVRPLEDLLQEPVYAKYIPGYSYHSFLWDDDDVDDKIRELATYETSYDIVVVLIASHGHETWGISCPLGYGFNHWLTPNELKSPLSILESNNLIVIVSTCHSGMFIDKLSQLSNNHHIMTACRDDESSYGGSYGYKYYWSIEDKIAKVGSYFPHFLYEAFLLGDSTSDAFIFSYGETVPASQYRQYPQEHYSLVQYLNLVG